MVVPPLKTMAYNELLLFCTSANSTSFIHLPPLGHTSKINLCPPFVVTLVCLLFTSSSEESKVVTIPLSHIANYGNGERGEPGNGGIPVPRPPPYQDMDVSARLGEDRGSYIDTSYVLPICPLPLF